MTRSHLVGVGGVVGLVFAMGCRGPSVEPVSEKQDKPSVTPKVPGTPNEPPGFEIPAHKLVGVGQEIGFGLEVIDQESDVIRVELVDKPVSATYDPVTLTVTWKATAADMPAGEFAVRVTETQRATGQQRAFLHRFSIAVTKSRQPVPVAQPMGPVVETVITIHDVERLSELNKRWPLDDMLLFAAQNAHAHLSKEVRETTAEADKETTYRTFLKQMALAHKNPRVDPESETFDKKSFGDAKDWKIIAVRPRLDKKWHSIRIIYKANKAHAATYAMFKWRVASGTEAADDAQTFNNHEMSRLVFEAFFREDGTLDEKLVADKQAHAGRVADFVDRVLKYEHKDKPWARGTFLGLPMEARLGGGSVRDADGNYKSGDGWGWHVMKAKPHDGRMEFVNVPIKGFATDVVAGPDGKKWIMKCAPRFDPSSDAHDGNMSGLCRPSGHVDLPGEGDGYAEAQPGSKAVSSFVDAAHLFVEYKRKHMTERIALSDPRRDQFEEKGMTCSQCHVRKFGVRDMHDRAAFDPSAGTPAALNKKRATTYFVIVPTVSWQPYAIDFQHKQECKFAVAFEKNLGKKTSLGCPLKGQ